MAAASRRVVIKVLGAIGAAMGFYRPVEALDASVGLVSRVRNRYRRTERSLATTQYTPPIEFRAPFQVRIQQHPSPNAFKEHEIDGELGIGRDFYFARYRLLHAPVEFIEASVGELFFKYGRTPHKVVVEADGVAVPATKTPDQWLHRYRPAPLPTGYRTNESAQSFTVVDETESVLREFVYDRSTERVQLYREFWSDSNLLRMEQEFLEHDDNGWPHIVLHRFRDLSGSRGICLRETIGAAVNVPVTASDASNEIAQFRREAGIG